MTFRLEPRERKRQKSVSFKQRQLDFLDNHPEFDLNEVCQKFIDSQIALADPKFLNKYDERYPK